MQRFIDKMSPTEKRFFYATCFIVFLAILDRVFLGPALNKLKSLDAEIVEQEQSIDLDKRILSYEDKIIRDSAEFRDYFTEKVQEDDVVKTNFLSAIEQLASRSDVILIKSSPSDIIKNKKYYEYYAQIDCSGNFENMINFMYDINTHKELLKIVKFNLTPKRGSPEVVNASMTIVKLVIPKEDTKITPVE